MKFSPELEKSFTQFFNRIPRGDLKATLSGSTTYQMVPDKLYLKVIDNLGSEELKIKFVQPPKPKSRQDLLFVPKAYTFATTAGAAFKTRTDTTIGGWESMGTVLYGQALLRNGKSVPVIMEFNIPGFKTNGPITLKYIDKKGVHPLFEALLD